MTGIALLQFLTLVGLGRWIGLPALLIGHVVICLPFSVRTIAISLAAMPAMLELAAASLGAPPLRGAAAMSRCRWPRRRWRPA